MSKSVALAAFRTELQAKLAEIDLPAEGMADFARVADNDERDMKNQGEAGARDYKRRRDIIQDGLTYLDKLEADGYPDLAKREVSVETLKLMDEQIETMQAARALFVAPDQISSVEFKPDAPEPVTPTPPA